MPDGTNCGECSHESCGECAVWHEHQIRKRRYGRWVCTECGHDLEIWLDQIEEEMSAEDNDCVYERHHLMWHCTECGCDYENYWEIQWGDTIMTPLQRKMWG